MTAVGATVKVMIEEQVGEQLKFEMEYETPFGTPERARVTDWVVPAVNVFVIVFVVYASPLVLVTLDVPELERV